MEQTQNLNQTCKAKHKFPPQGLFACMQALKHPCALPFLLLRMPQPFHYKEIKACAKSLR
jgi:hypothetical protein